MALTMENDERFVAVEVEEVVGPLVSPISPVFPPLGGGEGGGGCH